MPERNLVPHSSGSGDEAELLATSHGGQVDLGEGQDEQDQVEGPQKDCCAVCESLRLESLVAARLPEGVQLLNCITCGAHNIKAHGEVTFIMDSEHGRALMVRAQRPRSGHSSMPKKYFEA